MHRADSALFEHNFNRHHFAAMGENTARNAVAQVVKLRVFMKDKHRAVL